MELNDRVVLVAGGSGVLGSLVAREMAARGARVALAGRNQSALEETACAIPGAIVSRFDLTDQSSLGRPIEDTLEAFGRLDGLVNAAGVVAFGPLETTPSSGITELIATNLTGPLVLIQQAIPHLDGGFIVNLTGIVAEQPVGGMVAYSAAKAGLSAASAALTRELRRQRILVIDVRAPHTETGLATRPVTGSAPRLPKGLAPESVARMIVDAVETDRRSLAPGDFSVTDPS
jgi:NAD(P)-dependent dehydrogenase (short-subunit alcohol dehydrogenase family)